MSPSKINIRENLPLRSITHTTFLMKCPLWSHVLITSQRKHLQCYGSKTPTQMFSLRISKFFRTYFYRQLTICIWSVVCFLVFDKETSLYNLSELATHWCFKWLTYFVLLRENVCICEYFGKQEFLTSYKNGKSTKSEKKGDFVSLFFRKNDGKINIIEHLLNIVTRWMFGLTKNWEYNK